MSTTRRKLLGLGIGAGAAGVAAGLAGPVVGAVLGPETTVREGDGFLDVGALDDFPEGVPTRVLLRSDRQDAWALLRNVELGAAYVLRKAGAAVAYSTVCPHLGCAIDHDPDRDVFVCPCHDSAFGLDGSKQSGPSRSGLFTLDTRVDEGRVLVRFQRFG